LVQTRLCRCHGQIRWQWIWRRRRQGWQRRRRKRQWRRQRLPLWQRRRCFPDFFFTAIFDLPFLTFFGGVTIEVDVLGPLEGLASDGDLLIVFAMVVLILCCVVFF
jgi:hypothetical protein